ncbi:hypothetical protein AAVH_07020 [Aphelenchoides avenae]|nr:hypothetical protein AAVH_07020 [Aphelenchus avenae]
MISDLSEPAHERRVVTVEKVGHKAVKKTIRSWNNEAKKVFDSALARSKNEIQGSMALGDLFRPRTRADFFANFDCVSELYEWFAAWKKKLDRDPPTKELPSKKRNRTDGGESDEDYICEHRSLPNPLVLNGPLGSGKTSMVHSIADESGFKIIELSVGDKRDASALKQKISGALSSYYVNNQGADIRSMFQPKPQDGKNPSDRSKHTAIFLDDVDVVYASDDRFWSTLKSLCEESKIPMLLACTKLEAVENSLCETPALEDYRILTLQKPSMSQFTTFLQPWILGQSGFVLDSETAKQIASMHDSDVRRTMCELHYQLLGSAKLDFLPNSTSEAPSNAFDCRLIPLLAELDAVLGATPHETVAWTANDVTYLDFAGPNADKQDPLKGQLREIFNEHASSARKPCAGLPVNEAVINCRLRSVPRDIHQLRAVAMDYLPAMFEMNKTYQQKTKLSRRSIHPFAAVDYATGTAIDVRGHLIGSLPGYGLL